MNAWERRSSISEERLRPVSLWAPIPVASGFRRMGALVISWRFRLFSSSCSRLRFLV